jgi:hypothetical protein
MPEKTLRAGVATANITPFLGANLAGGMTNRLADHVHDELHVRALVIDNGEARIALAVCDLCVIAKAQVDQAKQMIARHTGIPATHVLVSATHTHSAPAAAHLFQSEPDPFYLDQLVFRIVDAVRNAVHRLEPARIGWGVGREESMVFNRRFFMKPGTIPADPFGQTTDRVQMNPPAESPNLIEPAGPTDPDVNVLAVVRPDGSPIAIAGNYALHYVGPGVNNDITADYFGAFAEAMARLVGASGSHRERPFVAMMTNACSGNINNVDFRAARERRAPYEQMYRVADIVAAEAYRVWRGMEFHDWVDLRASVENLDLGVRMPTGGEVAAAQALLGEADLGSNFTERPKIYARETVVMHGAWPDVWTVPVQAIRIGDLGIATFPGEAFVELGLEVKAKSPFKPTFLVELANDYAGYIPTVEGHRQGGYETWRAKSSFLKAEAAPKMVGSALRQLKELSG